MQSSTDEANEIVFVQLAGRLKALEFTVSILTVALIGLKHDPKEFIDALESSFTRFNDQTHDDPPGVLMAQRSMTEHILKEAHRALPLAKRKGLADT